MENLLNKKGFICDMDGVIYHGNRLLPGVPEFLNWLNENKKNFLFLTNSSQYTPKELQQKLKRISVFYQYCFSLSSLRLFLWPCILYKMCCPHCGKSVPKNAKSPKRYLTLTILLVALLILRAMYL